MKVTALIVAVVLSGSALSACQTPADRKAQFRGACKLLEGKVEGSVCIKDGKVVLTKKEFEAK